MYPRDSGSEAEAEACLSSDGDRKLDLLTMETKFQPLKLWLQSGHDIYYCNTYLSLEQVHKNLCFRTCKARPKLARFRKKTF
jgi:hypothetical protein